MLSLKIDDEDTDVGKEKPGTFVSMRELFKNGLIPVRGSCLRRLHVRKMLGSGHFGAAYLASSKDDEGKQSVLKFFGSMEEKKVTDEQQLSVKAGELGVGPKIYDSWVCTAEQNDAVFVGMLDMELWDGTLTDWVKYAKKQGFSKAEVKKYVEFIAGRIRPMVERLHCNNIAHNDLNPGNILLKYEDGNKHKIENVAISDYGMAKRVSKSLSRYLRDDLFNTDWTMYDALVKYMGKELKS